MPPAGLWPCLFLGLSLFFHTWFHSASYKAAFFHAFLFGIGYFTTGLWWIGNALLIEGNEFWWVWPISVIGLPTLLSIFTGLFAVLARYFFRAPRLSTWIGFAACLTLSEWTRGHIFTGFPWNLYGYAWSRHLEMLQGANLFGAYGLTFFSVLAATAPAALWLMRPDKIRMLVIGVGTASLLTALFVYGITQLKKPVIMNDDVAVRVVQANIEQTLKWDPAQTIPHFEKHLALSSANPTDKKLFILWPETAIPPALINNAAAREKIAAMLRGQSPQAYLLTGALLHEQDDAGERYYNALSVIDAQGVARATYAKTHLVPFGEFIPFQQWIPIRPVVQFQGFEAGNGPTTLQIDDMPSFSPLICYEIIFPGQTVDEQERPAFLAAVTNDGWYGDSAGPRQHFFQVRLRSIEEGLPAIRAANTGISGIIDPYGRVIAESALFEETAIDSALPAPLPPTLFAATGNLFWAILIAFIAAACALRQKYYV